MAVFSSREDHHDIGNMIIPILASDYEPHRQTFRSTVRDIFPMLSYTPEQVEVFLTRWNAHEDGQFVFLVRTRFGQAFARRIGWDIQYLIPSHWENRYAILRQALREIKADFQSSGAEKLSIGINDGFPSHNLYFAGMLPMMGFEVHSGQIMLEANAEFLNRLTLPALPPGVREVTFASERLSEYAALYAQAHTDYGRSQTSQIKQHDWLSTMTKAAEQEDLRKTWISLESEGRIVASCYGGCRPERWGNFMSVEELAILPEFFGRGIGRYTLIRCLQELQRHYGTPGRPFEIGTWRHMGARPLRLYLGLGFQVTKAETYASWHRV